MALATGTHEIGQGRGSVWLRTSRTGLGRRAGHDLALEVTRFSGRVTVGDDPGHSSVEISLDTRSIEVREGTGGVKPLTDKDRRDIKGTIEGRGQLDSQRFSEITFRSKEVRGTPEALEVVGDLTVRGQTRPIRLRATVDPGGRLQGAGTIVQSEFGIRPYTAFLGALKLADSVQIRFQLQLPKA